jgi:excisionase family DNA binding protein
VPDDQPRFLSAAAAAQLLGVSDATLYRQLTKGEFPGIKIGQRWIVPMKAIDKMEEDAINDWTAVDAAQYVVSKRDGSGR